jgi:hypothetical protein
MLATEIKMLLYELMDSVSLLVCSLELQGLWLLPWELGAAKVTVAAGLAVDWLFQVQLPLKMNNRLN